MKKRIIPHHYLLGGLVIGAVLGSFVGRWIMGAVLGAMVGLALHARHD